MNRMPAQHGFKIGQRKASGHWEDFETLKQELQPYLHPILQPGPGSDNPTAASQRHHHAAGVRQQIFSKGKGVMSSSQQGCYKMVTQQELMGAGRMDLLNAVRLWGGFTAVADRMGALPNTRCCLRLVQCTITLSVYVVMYHEAVCIFYDVP